MSGIIDKEILQEAGWPRGPLYRDIIAAAREYEERGIEDVAYLLKLLERRFPKPDPKIPRRDEPVAFGEAIEATCQEDEANIAAVRRQMNQLLRTPVIDSGAVMPDACPAGVTEAVIPVGGAIAVKNAIIPAAHSADICCSMYASVFDSKLDISEMLDSLMESTRFGPGGRSPDKLVHHPVIDEPVWENPFLKGLERHATIHMADQGDGNHFAFLGKIRIDRDLIDSLREAGHDREADGFDLALSDGASERYVLVTHHGSRGLGAKLYGRGQKAAVAETAKVAEGIPAASAWLDTESETGRDYWEALQYVGRWTRANHESIHKGFLERTEAQRVTDFGNEHNFVWKRGEHFLHGKGATPAWSDEEGRPLLGLIPLNMAEPILVVLGKNNEDYLGFAPHGAGRNRSRTATLRPFKKRDGSMDEAEIERIIAQTTEGLDIRWWHGKADLSETPVAYKSAAQVKEQIQHFGLAEIIAEIEPLGCIMAGDGGKPWLSRKDKLSPKQLRQIEHRAERRKKRQSIRPNQIDEFYEDQ